MLWKQLEAFITVKCKETERTMCSSSSVFPLERRFYCAYARHVEVYLILGSSPKAGVPKPMQQNRTTHSVRKGSGATAACWAASCHDPTKWADTVAFGFCSRRKGEGEDVRPTTKRNDIAHLYFYKNVKEVQVWEEDWRDEAPAVPVSVRALRSLDKRVRRRHCSSNTKKTDMMHVQVLLPAI